jgi:prevent-host-death family protein
MHMTIRALRANLSDALESVAAGSEIVITRRGIPVARLVAPEPVAASHDFLALRSRIPAWDGPSLGEDLIAARRHDRLDHLAR